MKFFLESIGCRLNQAELEKFALQIRHAGHELVSRSEEANWVILNTCTVTAHAAADSRQMMRRILRNSHAKLVLTGCWATLEFNDNHFLGEDILRVPNSQKGSLLQFLKIIDENDSMILKREPLPGVHHRTRAFIKVQDGCDQFCTYCITRIARGASWSVPMNEIFNDIYAAIAGGSKEVVLTGVQIGGWGRDLSQPRSLPDLISKILSDTDLQRLRLSSLEPWELTESFLPLWNDTRFCRHLHLPLQSGSLKTLRRMGRKITPEQFLFWVKLLQKNVPGIAITTDLIAGFPGENKVDFEESMEFIKECDLAGGHVFTFSPRAGTAAAEYPLQVPMEERKHRSALYRDVLSQSTKLYIESFIGKTLDVLWESEKPKGKKGWYLQGHSDNFIRVSSNALVPLWNQISNVEISEVDEMGLVGNIKKG